MNRRGLILAGLFWVLAIAGWNIAENEQILARGRVIRLELAPVDPRSLLQGDYMALNYAVQNAVRGSAPREDGFVVMRLDERGVGKYLRTQPAAEPLAGDEISLRYRIRGRGVRIATNAFFFQEGDEPKYRNARFGEFRVAASGEPRLVALLDANLQKLGDNRF